MMFVTHKCTVLLKERTDCEEKKSKTSSKIVNDIFNNDVMKLR